MVDDVDSTKNIPVSRSVPTLSYARTLDGRLATSTGSSRWAGTVLAVTDIAPAARRSKVVLKGRIEYPLTTSMSAESEEHLGCVTAS